MSNPTTSRPRSLQHRHGRCGARGFSLLELIVVIAVTMMLTSLLLPAMNKVRENVNRVVCSSNLRQIGMGVSMFASNRNDQLPQAAVLEAPHWQPDELMAAYQGSEIGWDGLGLLFVREYCGAFECFYCPSHRGSHSAYRYAEMWDEPGTGPIYTNYHYAGQRDWADGTLHAYNNIDTLVLATDGLRTASDFNHGHGMNVLHGDISVRWRPDLIQVLELLPEASEKTDVEERFANIWGHIQSLISPGKSMPDAKH